MSDEENKPAPTNDSVEEDERESSNGDTSHQEATKDSPSHRGAGDHVKQEDSEEKTDGDAETGVEATKETPKKGRKRKRPTESESPAKEEKEGPNGETPGSGKRQRKKVQKLEFTKFTQREKPKDIPEGHGDKLGDMPRVELFLSKTHAEDLKPLHRIMFNRTGQASEIKKNIRKFYGFAWEKDSPEYEKKTQQMTRYTMATLRLICDVLDIEKKGTKEDVMTKVIGFLMDPHASGKAMPKPKRRKSGSGNKGKEKKERGKKKKVVKEKKKPSSPRKKPAKSKEEVEESEDEEEDAAAAESDTADSDVDEGEKSGEESEQSAEKSSEEEEEEEPSPKKKVKKEKEKEKAKTPKKVTKTPKKEAKKPAPKKATTPKPKKKKPAPVSDEDDSSDDEPLIAKKGPPSDEELRDVIKKILDSANLEEVTMKTVCRQVFDKYPDFDLQSRKDFIKNTVKQIIR